MSAQALAAEVEVSVRTIYRDIDQLSAAGVPVYAERGRAGGFQLLDGWRTRLTGFTDVEAQTLLLAGLPGPTAELGLGEALATARLKLLAALPEGWRQQAQRVGGRFHLDPLDWHRRAARVEHLSAVAAAVWTDRRLKIQYERWNGRVERVVDPLGLVLKAGVWYFAGRVGGETRTYRVSSILSLTLLEENFVRPAQFDLAAYWSTSTARFEATLHQETAVLRVSPRGLKRLASLSATLEDAVARTPEPPRTDAWTRIVIPIESIDHAALQLLRLGAEAEILEPPALRERLAETVRRLARLYDPPLRSAQT